MTIVLNGTTGITTPTTSTTGEFVTSVTGFKNRIINGAMVIDARNAGASVTPTSNGYTLDRWRAVLSASSKYSVQQNAGAVTPPTGFKNYLGVTSLSAYTVGTNESFYLQQPIEGFNTSDLDFGTANAKTITLSFWVRSSLTGTFGGSLWNSAVDRLYPFTYTILAANTWEYETITITGDTTGTWIGATNGVGLFLNILLGAGSGVSGTANAWGTGTSYFPTGATSVVGTNGATFYITGVQLEKGSTATSFDYRPYGTELALCQRYYYRIKNNTGTSGAAPFGGGVAQNTTLARIFVPFPVTMRTFPTALEQTGTASDYRTITSSSIACTSVPTYSSATEIMADVSFNTTGLVAGHGAIGLSNTTAAYLGWSAEL